MLRKLEEEYWPSEDKLKPRRRNLPTIPSILTTSAGYHRLLNGPINLYEP